jgi:hypothetical protein
MLINSRTTGLPCCESEYEHLVLIIVTYLARYFKARNGTYKRVPQIPNSGFNGVNGGMTVYYMQDGLYNFQQTSKVQAFKPVSSYRLFESLLRSEDDFIHT